VIGDAGLDEAAPAELPLPGALASAQALLRAVNGAAAVLSAVAMAVAGAVLTWEATARYLFKIPSDWQDELSILLLVGATFMSAGWVQARRGHVGIDTLASLLPAAADRIRRRLVDIVTLVFCAFFCWKTWTLLAEAVSEGQTTDSAWAPPLWIPYGCMAVGMSILVLQLMLQVLAGPPPRRIFLP
jgi:TRAP-type C4-dicarboxylate transport system permease small subunit